MAAEAIEVLRVLVVEEMEEVKVEVALEREEV